MERQRIIDIELDERSILRRNEDIEQERRVAVFDLLEKNCFDANGHEGPFRVKLRVEDNRLAIDIKDESGEKLDTVRMALGRFRRPIREYFAICESYFKAVRSEHPRGIEALDMARRGLHNDAAELLKDCLKERIEMDFDTARRLFTLICVLHIKQSTTAVDSPTPATAPRAR
ncbi:UPF0262 family protein [Sphingosinicella sp. CPCC 101087]|uniref:UPF0262 family protein n=1 Tax=Sphingosinicella sp. CPCC 101087 TaxID=2497754 RepID=UPI00101B84AA|nr:UPF0262 family protein [Sphingosinicella sp. CPCC 101087]